MSNIIRLGNKCNQNCVFCTVALDNERELNTEETKDKIRFLAKRKAGSITFTGGEPTLREDLPELIKFAKDSGIEYVELQTNAILLHRLSMAEKMIESGVDAVLVSLHSHNEKVSEILTGSPQTFKKTLQGISNLTKLCKNVRISHVINSMNYKDLCDFVKFIKRGFPKVSYIYFSFVRPNGNALKNRWVVPKLSDIDLYVYRALDCCRSTGIHFGVEGIPLCYMQGFEEYSAELQRLLSKPVFYISDRTLKSDTHRYIKTNLKQKGESCEYCSLDDICCGVWKEYAELYGTGELFPVFVPKSDIIKKNKR